MNEPSLSQLLQQRLSPETNICLGRSMDQGKDQFMFTKHEIESTVNPIAKLFRLIVQKFKITEKAFCQKAQQYKLSIGMSDSVAKSTGNLRKTVYGPRLTMQAFEQCLRYLDCEIVDLHVYIKDNSTGEIHAFTLGDSVEDVEQRKPIVPQK